MSRAAQCDRCEALFIPTDGCITLDVHQQKGDRFEEKACTWKDIDLCQACSRVAIDMLYKACTAMQASVCTPPD
jgi:hypothetical protein